MNFVLWWRVFCQTSTRPRGSWTMHLQALCSSNYIVVPSSAPLQHTSLAIPASQWRPAALQSFSTMCCCAPAQPSCPTQKTPSGPYGSMFLISPRHGGWRCLHHQLLHRQNVHMHNHTPQEFDNIRIKIKSYTQPDGRYACRGLKHMLLLMSFYRPMTLLFMEGTIPIFHRVCAYTTHPPHAS